VAACDIVHAASSLVEVYRTVDAAANTTSAGTASGDSAAVVLLESAEASRIRAFDEAYDCLGMKDEETLKRGLQLSISLQKLIVRKASGLLEDYLQIQKLKNLYFVSVSNGPGFSGGGGGESIPGTGSSSGNGGGGKGDGDSEAMDSPFSRPMVLARLGQVRMLRCVCGV